MDSENKIHDVDNDSEMKFPDTKDSEESGKVQSNSLEDSSISRNIDCSSVTSESSVTLKDTSHIVGFDNNLACETMKNGQANKPMELSAEDEIKITTDVITKCDKTNDVLKEILYSTNFNSVDLSKATTSQDNSLPSSSSTNEANTLHTDQNKVKRSISKGQVGSGTSIEKSDDSSDEDSSKRQKLNKSACNASAGNVNDDIVMFQRNKSKVKLRKYRRRRNITSDNEDSSNNTLSNEATREAFIPDTDEGNVASASTRNDSTQNETSNRNSETRRAGSDTSNDESDRYKDERADSNEWRTTNDEDEYDEEEEYEEEIPYCLKIEKPPPNWRIVPEMINRQIGSNPLFQRRFYGSLHAVERLELMYNLNEHQGCVNALNFNQKGNLLASASDDLAVVIWDWAVGKKRHWFMSGHTSNMFQAKWLPLDVEYLMVTCARDGQVRLLDLEHDTSKKLAAHRGPSHKLAVHHETPHVVFSAGEDARVFSIDIRESKPNKLLVVKEGSSEVQLFSIHSNPFNSNEFCVGGRSHYVRVYDRRKVSTPLYKLCPDHLTGNKHAHVTCAVYNHNGTEILASYNDEDIYLFDRFMSSHVDYAHRYQGHRNSATVKGVNFFGPKSEYVISGSDCGNIFIWDKNMEAVVQWMAGDKQGVVNCLEGHPHIPILATSGLDYDVKIWVPSCGEPPMMKSLANCVKSNARNRKQENVPDSFDSQLLWMLLRHIHRERVRNFYTRYGLEDPNRYEDDDEDYHFDDSSMDSSSEDSDNQSESDVRRIQCPPS
ncbi:PREDICTED: DDB1- and CUL4-associated factor 8-like isoform X1 [Cyphomyrmex costatus]|uniref:DDB1- and CUL4-associated factor 8-like isoform X1 n=1 Tax=Cyphomyrmex costatus TaxID=456900 RepID=UPI0008523BE1|nr:PREDICTED: DDB1- and CUL4-associated factor 8-like isoform X1 [Cyphomyrmex costatus]XP_018398343.1 PREDICTED: DDB1- and CUL4-associated factor 8-like isoform X1 [Cyphomyrmex costatus]